MIKKKRTFDKNAKIAKKGEENCSLIGEGSGNNVETFLMGRKSIVISEKAPIRHHKCPYIYIYINRPFVNRKSFLLPTFPASIKNGRVINHEDVERFVEKEVAKETSCVHKLMITLERNPIRVLLPYFSRLSLFLSLYVCSRDTFLSKSGTNEVNQYSLRTVKKKGNQISLRDEED